VLLTGASYSAPHIGENARITTAKGEKAKAREESKAAKAEERAVGVKGMALYETLAIFQSHLIAPSISSRRVDRHHAVRDFMRSQRDIGHHRITGDRSFSWHGIPFHRLWPRRRAQRASVLRFRE
jgi:hypothetical protein